MAAKERSSFTLSTEVKRKLEAAVPKNCRSQFIEQAIQQALINKTKQELFELIDSIAPQQSEISSVELVNAIREEGLSRLKTEKNV
jgi:hypothetical protein